MLRTGTAPGLATTCHGHVAPVLRQSNKRLSLGRNGALPRRRIVTRTVTGAEPAAAYNEDVGRRVVEARSWISQWRTRSSGYRNGNGSGAVSNGSSVIARSAAVPEPSPETATPAPAPASTPAPAPPAANPSELKHWALMLVGISSLYFMDRQIAGVLASAGIKFPSSLVGMFAVFGVLCAVGEKSANSILTFYSPALAWIARWLPLFYVPSLITLPLALQGMPVSDLVKTVGVLCVGMVGTLLFTAQSATVIRELVKTPMKEIARAKPAPPFLASHYLAWGAILVASLAVTALVPSLATAATLPAQMAATVGGYLAGSAVPKGLQGLLHPVVVTALLANGLTYVQGALLGLDYTHGLATYFTKGIGGAPWGAGDVLMSLLPCVIVSFGFRIYTQRDTMVRHASEILGATVLSSLFSLFSTAFMCKALGIGTVLAKSLIPRSVTVALALPISAQLEANLSITAAAVLLQGIIGANFGPNLMTVCGMKDTIARGLAAAATAGGLGTASLTAKEPEALPFCALSYAMIGILSTLIMAVPAVRQLLITIVS